MVDGQPNQDLLRNLGPNSAVLRKQTEAFLKVEAQANIQIVNFYETSVSNRRETGALKIMVHICRELTLQFRGMGRGR